MTPALTAATRGLVVDEAEAAGPPSSAAAPRDPLLWVLAIVTAIASAVVWTVWIATAAPLALAFALGVQPVVGVTMAYVARPARRALAAALATVVPIVGPLAIAWTDEARGAAEPPLLHEPEAAAVRQDGIALARRLTSSLPSCEALVSGDVDARRATLTRLGQRARAEDLAILRWARTQPTPELAVEAALAYEEVGASFEQRVQAARRSTWAEPSFETHAAVVREISAGIVSGAVDPALVGTLAAEARTHYAAALALAPASTSTLVAARARIELAARQPAVALALLADAGGVHADAEVAALYTEAAYAARRFELAPGMVTGRDADARG